MPNVLIRDVPEATHQRLKEKAAALGMSLQAFLGRLLDEEARKPLPGEWAADVERRLLEAGAEPGDFTHEEILDTIEGVRREHGEHFERVSTER